MLSENSSRTFRARASQCSGLKTATIGRFQARTTDELTPVADYWVNVPVTYRPPLPFIVPPLNADFNVVVQPQVEIRYSSQLEAEFSQWWVSQADHVTNPDASIIFKAHSEALANFSLSAGIDLTITASLAGISVGPTTVTIVGPLHPRVTLQVPGNSTPGEQIIGRADAFPDPRQTNSAVSSYDAPLASITPPDSSASDPNQFVKQCLAQKPASQPVPQPTATPGNSDIFQNNLYYPCNICLGNLEYQYNDNSTPPVVHTIPAQAQVFTPASPNGPTDWTCTPDHVAGAPHWQMAECGCDPVSGW